MEIKTVLEMAWHGDKNGNMPKLLNCTFRNKHNPNPEGVAEVTCREEREKTRRWGAVQATTLWGELGRGWWTDKPPHHTWRH